ncbi:hypothetical protein SAMD00019534_103200, partial [Acytostelium subglobosum LB1]|uniref:hypothetical protein n=1 Tax=Acytostelium subglobosum LB1 TaxID=1410327 RepID=UPI00064492CE
MDRYLIDESKLQMEELEFSKGSFSKVYKGCYNGRSVCVKVIKKDMIDPELLVFIDREVDILQDLLDHEHRNIVQFIGVGGREQLLFLVTELISGGDLGTLLYDSTAIKIPWSLKLNLAKDIAEGMVYLHSKNIMHRDLKSNNLLIGDDWSVKICDFGFAKIIAPHTMTTTICGTDEWMSPEVILGMSYNFSADIYSYGMVLIELITQCRLQERLPQNSFDIDEEQLNEILPSDCPEEFWKLAKECCSYTPEDRPDFSAIVQKLEDIIAKYGDDRSDYPPPPVVAPAPDFEDDNSLQNWCLLSNLPDDVLEDQDQDVSDDNKVDVDDNKATTTSTWSCSI